MGGFDLAKCRSTASPLAVTGECPHSTVAASRLMARILTAPRRTSAGSRNPTQSGHSRYIQTHMRAAMCGGAGFCAAFALAACEQQFDASKVDAALTGLEPPYRRVEAVYFGDGGSVGIRVTDRQERSQFFFVSAKLDEANPYSRVFAGGIPGQDSSAREVADSGATKNMMIAILRAKIDRTPDEDLCLAKLSSNPLDYLRTGVRKLLGQ
jgi:hypothetical protein